MQPHEEAKGTNIISRGDWSDGHMKMTIVDEITRILFNPLTSAANG
jgi:hypothetical protein